MIKTQEQNVFVQGKAIFSSEKMAFSQKNKTETHKTIIKRIDDALYQSKENGRNRCTIL